MLVHVVRYTKVQKLVGEQVEIELKDIRQRFRMEMANGGPAFWMSFNLSGRLTSYPQTWNAHL